VRSRKDRAIISDSCPQFHTPSARENLGAGAAAPTKFLERGLYASGDSVG